MSTSKPDLPGASPVARPATGTMVLDGPNAALAQETARAVGLRIMPLLAAAYFLASLDRVNVGFAALQMNRSIGLGPSAFGLGAGILFVAYAFTSVPGALFVQRVGAKRGLALIMVGWGVASAGTAFVTGPLSFYAMRILLGIAEAAFFPSVILYLTLWLPPRDRGKLLAILMMGLPLASVFGSPLSAALLTTDGWLGLGGWQWLFLVEGAPAALLGLVLLWLVPSVPDEAPWLGPAHRRWLSDELARERASGVAPPPSQPIWRVLVDRDVLGLTLVNIGAIAVTNGLAIWQPQLIHSFGLTTLQTGVLNALPFALGSLALFLWSWHSDRTNERRLHTAAPLLVGCIALAAMLAASSLPVAILVMCVAVSAASMVKGPFWALATEIIPARNGAAAFGQITSLTNVGAFAGTYGIGAIVQATGGYTYAMLPLMVMMLGAFVCALAVGRRHVRSVQAQLDASPS